MSTESSAIDIASETSNDEHELNETLDKYLDKEPQTDEQKAFNDLSMAAKLAKLDQLVKKSQVFSQIILDNMMEKSMQKKRLQERIDRGEVVLEVHTPVVEVSSLSSESDSDSELDSDSSSDADSESTEAEESELEESEEENVDGDGNESEHVHLKPRAPRSRIVDTSEQSPEEESSNENDSSEEDGNLPEVVDVEVIDSESEEDKQRRRVIRRQQRAKERKGRKPTIERQIFENRKIEKQLIKPDKSLSKLERMKRYHRLRTVRAKIAALLMELDRGLSSSDDSDGPTTGSTTRAPKSAQAKRRILTQTGPVKRAKMSPDIKPTKIRSKISKKKSIKESKEKSNKKSKKMKIKKPKSTISKATSSTKQALEAAQTGHNQDQPSLVSGCTMKDYQLDGLEWLVTLYENGLNGILADEMGLGKTLECIALLAYLLEHGVKGPFLVVAPLSTVASWCREFNNFAPRIKVLKYVGKKEDRTKLILGKQLKAQVVVTSYELIIRDFRKFALGKWAYLTVDEGHRLKNFDCLLIKFLKKLKVGNRLLLTGTPLQNNLKELWSLLNFILPDIFQDLELFQQWFDFDTLGDSVEGSSEEERRLLKMKVQELFVKNLHVVLKPFLLRRVKSDVMKELPPKKEYILYSDLTPVQSVFYRAIMDHCLPEMILNSYIKEYLLINQSDLFSTKEDLGKVDDILNYLLLNKRLIGKKRNCRTRFADEDIHKMLTGDMSDFIDDESVTGPQHQVNAYEGNSGISDNSNENDERDSAKADMTKEDLAQAGLDELLAQYEKTAEMEVTDTEFEDFPTDETNIRGAKKAYVDLGGSLMGVITPESEDGKKDIQTKDGETIVKGVSEVKGESRPEDERKADGSISKHFQESSDDDTFYSVNDHSDIEVIEVKSDDEEESTGDKMFRIVEDTKAKFLPYVRSLALKNMIMQMRKVCCSHLCYYDPYNLETDHQVQLGTRILEYSGKMQMLRQLLRRLIADGHKVLIFSQFTTALDFIRLVVEQEGIRCSQLDGRSAQEDREEEIADFSRDGADSSQVFLLSTRAGGLGLNLVSADTVILFDNDWNPQMDLQAIDRAHRIGQTKPVKAFRFVVRDTVEELLILRSFSKRLLEKMVIEEGDFRLGGLARKLAKENIDFSEKGSISSLIELGERLDLLGSSKSRESVDKFNDFVLQPHPIHEPLTPEEMEELMDRSDECYTRGTLPLANVTSFDASNMKSEG